MTSVHAATNGWSLAVKDGDFVAFDNGVSSPFGFPDSATNTVAYAFAVVDNAEPSDLDTLFDAPCSIRFIPDLFGDGFCDAFEVANIMNPLVQADFTPSEPDLDHNGRIDLWETAPYFYGFTDADHDGFDDYYELYALEPESDANFDVVVKVYTTRSAVLTWNGGVDGIVILSTTGQAVRLRLPFGVDSTLRLLPSPEGIDPPSGELWKSRMRFAFSPRSGQNLYGNALVSPDGMIAHKVVNQENAIEFFAPFSPTSGFQTMSLTGGGSVGLSTDIKARRFDVHWIDKYHGLYDGVGAFTVTNLLGMGDAVYDWSSAFGDMEPESGMESCLTVARLPDDDEAMTVVTATELDSESRVAVTSIVVKCSQRVFSASISTNNFSPQLGETLGVGVTLPECEHIPIPGWLEIEVVREIIGATQHVASVDMDVETTAIDRYLDTSTLGGQTLGYAWDGRAQVSLPLADHPDVFTHTNAVPFHRAMPTITSGEPVPPPFYTVVVRMYNTEKTTILHQASWTIYVPQVVQVNWFVAAEALFRTPRVYAPDSTISNLVYSAVYAGDSNALMQDTLQRLRAYYPANVNIRFAPFFSSDIETAKFLFIDPDLVKKTVVNPDGERLEVYEYGLTSPATLQQSATGLSSCHFRAVYDNTYILYKNAIEADETQPFRIPVSSSQMLDAICRISAHEVGHALGLVDKHYLDGMGEKHNPGANDQTKMMNVNTELEWLFNVHSAIGWRPLNSQYLEFVLPIPK